MPDRVVIRDGTRVVIRQPAPDLVIREAGSTVAVRQSAPSGAQVASSSIVGPRGLPALSARRGSLVGAIDGVSLLFAAPTPFVIDSTVLYLNGLAQSVPDDYSEISATEIVMVEAPQTGDRLLITYLEA